MNNLISYEGYKDLTKKEKEKICNGMGSSQSKIDFIPDTFYGLNMNECGNIHDYMYYHGYSEFEKLCADAVFFYNMYYFIEKETKNKVLKYLRKKRAVTYCKSVVILGGSSYFLEEKNNKHLEPKFKGWFKWWKELKYENKLWKIIIKFNKDKEVNNDNYKDKLSLLYYKILP